MSLKPLLVSCTIFAGCAETARQKILSILHHTSNCHQFGGFTHFPECEHGDLGQERRPWIPPTSLAMTKLRQAICGGNNRNLDDLKYMTGKPGVTLDSLNFDYFFRIPAYIRH